MNSACGDIVLEERLAIQLTSALSLSLRLNVKRLRLNTEIVETDAVLGKYCTAILSFIS